MTRTTKSDITDVGSLYSPAVGMVFIFNLIVGTGALTMPNAFQQAGWLLSLILVSCIAMTSYITVTYILESMACANAMLLYKRRVSGVNGDQPVKVAPLANSGESTPLLSGPIADDYFKIRERVELGQMVALFFNKVGIVIFYICIIVYLYGDLAIYAVAVPKSLRDVMCTYKPPHINCSIGFNDTSLNDTSQCFPGLTSVSRMTAYRLSVIVFFFALGPFVFLNVQKTTLLQVLTSLLRWIAFAAMIILAIYELGRKGAQGRPKLADFTKVPDLFGVCVYSFMCHHSLPSLVTPIKKKNRLNFLFGVDYSVILGFYSLMSLTAVFAFKHIPDLYTLNFEPSICPNPDNPAPVFFQYFLALFPVFTLSTSFPIIGITLRNNLKTLFLKDGQTYHFVIVRILFPVLVLVPPLVVALITNEVEFLVGITGSYAGSALQYFVPIALVYCARRTVYKTFGISAYHKCISPFKHNFWLILLGVWAVACIGFVTVKHITSG